MRIASRAFGTFPEPAFTAAFVLLASNLAPEAALAAEPQVVVAVDCPVLGAEQRAALESRANAELLVRQESGTLVVVCQGGRAEITWHSSIHAGVSPRASVLLDADARVSVDRVLDEFDRLLNEAADAPGGAGDDASSVAIAPAAPSVAPSSVPAAPGSDLVPAPEPGPSNDSREAWRGVAVSAGATGELWSSRVAGALGPIARVETSLRSHVAVEVGGSLWWTLRVPDGVSATLVRLHAGALYVIDDARRFRIGALAFVDVLHASPDSSLHGAAVSRTVPGLGLHADYALLEGPFRVVTGPTLSGRLGAVRVEVGDREAFSIPAVAVGWSIEGFFGPF